MHGRNDRYGQAFDPVQHCIYRTKAFHHLRFGFETFELANVGADDEALLLA